MPQVQIIQPIQPQTKRLRVAAYARVSSDSADQLNSMSTQVDYYTHLIQDNPQWEFAGVYADEGISGTGTRKREQFNRLMEDCRIGLIDRVLVKSASRFARNTADALASVRELKSLGVTVAFEKEGFDTETANGEMLLSMICAVAQEESLSISKNMKWGVQKRMRAGTYINASTPYGYRQQNHQLIPYEKEAETVRFIYAKYLAGESIAAITAELNTIFPKQKVDWSYTAVQSILTNEKYRGDTCFQKRYTLNQLPFRKVRNKGEIPRYYLPNSHPAIIAPTEYEKVQTLMTQKRTERSAQTHYPLTKMAVCAFCGRALSPKARKNGSRVWNCKTHLADSEKCPVKPVQETVLYGAFLMMYNKIYENQEMLLNPILADMQKMQDIQSKWDEEKSRANAEILQMAKQLHNLTRIYAQGYIEEATYRERRSHIEQQLEEKRKNLPSRFASSSTVKEFCQTKELIHYLHTHTALAEFEETAMRAVVDKVVVSNECFTFVLKNGLKCREAR